MTFGEAVTVNTYWMEGGYVSQPVDGTDLTVTGMLNWSGGTINSSTHLANVTVSGSTATATIAPANGGTVTLGSTLNLSGGAVATAAAGTVNVTNQGVEFNVNANSGMLIDPGLGGQTSYSGNVTFGAQVNIVGEQSWFKVISVRYTSTGSLKNAGGSLLLMPETLTSFAGKVDNVNGGPSVQQTAGVTYLYKGSILELNNAEFGMLMSGGALSIQLDQGDGPSEVVGNLKVTGGDIVSGANAEGATHLYGTLVVEGNVTWTGGMYRPYLNAAFNWDSDVWHATGTFTIGGTAALAPSAVDGENKPVSPAADMHWILLLGDAGITAANNTPSYESNLWAIDRMNNPVTKWELRSK